MPYNTPPKCFICGKIHSCDTNDIVQMVNSKFVTVNVCKKHFGVEEEYQRQNNLSVEEKAVVARKSISTSEFKEMLNDYTNNLIKEHPHHEKFLKEMTAKFLERSF